MDFGNIPLPPGPAPPNAAFMVQQAINGLNPIPEVDDLPADLGNLNDPLGNLPGNDPPGGNPPGGNPPGGNPPAAVPRRGLPEYRKEYDKLIPQFNGEPLLLSKYIKQCDKIFVRFYDRANPDNFQNDVVLGAFTSKLGPGIADKIYLNSIDTYLDLRRALLQTYSDKRDTYTLTIELSRLKQNQQEDCFGFYDRVSLVLNSQVAYLQMHAGERAPYLVEYMKNLALRVFLHGIVEPWSSLLRTKAPNSLGAALSMLTNDFNMRPGSKDRVNPPFQLRPVPQNQSSQKTVGQLAAQRFAPKTFNPNFVRTPFQYQPRPFGQGNNYGSGSNFAPRTPQNFVRSGTPQNHQFNNFQKPNQQQQPNPQRSNFQNPQWNRPIKTESNLTKGPTPMSISTRNTNFNLITPGDSGQDQFFGPENEYSDPFLEPQNAQYFGPELMDQYNPYDTYASDFEQINQDFTNNLSFEPSQPSDDFLGETSPPNSST